jgi:hypothetical protein
VSVEGAFIVYLDPANFGIEAKRRILGDSTLNSTSHLHLLLVRVI